MITAHPTRNVPKCAECLHVIQAGNSLCNRPRIEVDLITGLPTMTCLQVRMTICGADAALFEPLMTTLPQVPQPCRA